jgi:3-oxoadipate enol-lactonase
VAQLVALAEPERVTRLILMDTGPRPVGRITDAWLDAVEAILQKEGMAGLLARLTPEPGDTGGETPSERRLRAEDPDYRRWSDEKFLATSPVALVALGRAMRSQADRLPALAGLPMPTLVLVGEEDEPFIAGSEAMAEAIPGARLVVLPEAGHCPQFEAPEAWWDAVSAFLTAP